MRLSFGGRQLLAAVVLVSVFSLLVNEDGRLDMAKKGLGRAWEDQMDLW